MGVPRAGPIVVTIGGAAGVLRYIVVFEWRIALLLSSVSGGLILIIPPVWVCVCTC